MAMETTGLPTRWKAVLAKLPPIAAAVCLLTLAGAVPCPAHDYLESFHNPPNFTGTVKVRRSVDWETTLPETGAKLTVKDNSNVTITVTGTNQGKAYAYSVGRKDGQIETSFTMGPLSGTFSGTISSEFSGPDKGHGPDLWTAPKRGLYLISGFSGKGTGPATISSTAPPFSETHESSAGVGFSLPAPYGTGGAAYNPDSGVITGRLTLTYYVNALSFLHLDLANVLPEDHLVTTLIPEYLKCPVTLEADWNFHVKLPEYKVKIIYPHPNQALSFGYMEDKEKMEIPAEAKADPKKFEGGIRPWDIDPIQGSELTKDPDPLVGPQVTFTFSKLPGDNDQFGKKTITADRAEPVIIRVFFNMFEDDGKTFARNNPGDNHDPNWFFYWKQGAVPSMSDFKYEDTEKWCGLFDPSDGQCYVGRPAARPYNKVTFNLRTPGGLKVISFPGTQPLDTCARTVAHELHHKLIQDMYGSRAAAARKGGDSQWYDYDRDGLPDLIEVALHKDLGIHWKNPDTHGLGRMFQYRDYGNYGDQELLCWLAERDARGIKEKDWSMPGSQSNW